MPLVLRVVLPNVSRMSLMCLLLPVFQLDRDYAMVTQQTATLQQYAADQKQHVQNLSVHTKQLQKNENSKQIRYCY